MSAQPVISQSTRAAGCSTLVGKLFLSLFFSVFLAAGIGFAVLTARSVSRQLATWQWTATPCTIHASRVEVEESSSRPYRFLVSYSYRFGDKEYASSAAATEPVASDDYADVQRLLLRYPSGAPALCYVDPDRPTSAVLQRPSPALVLIVLFPLLFVAVGAGGLFFAWRRSRSSTSAISRPLSSGTRTLAPLVAGLAFLAIGAPLTAVFLGLPLLRVVLSRSWEETPCRVISSRVLSHPGDDGTTYSVDILYEYRHGALTLRSNRYGFFRGSSSGSAGKQKVVRRYPQGAVTRCYVNRGDPADAVLDRSFQPVYLLGLIPLAFVGFGIALVASARRSARRRRAPSAPVEPLAAGPLALRPRVGRFGKLAAAIAVCLFWNGIVSVFVVELASQWRAGNHQWLQALFLTPFVLIGLGMIGAVVYFTLALANPRPRLELSEAEVRLGSTFELRWTMAGAASRIVHLEIVLEGREEATYQRGTTSHTDREVFARIEVVDTIFGPEIRGGQRSVSIPEDTMHSFSAPHNKVVWAFKVTGEIRRWPDVGEELELELLPLAAEAMA